MPELSIIVPVYKVEPYLRRCLDSILAQTFRDFELILIDDGSPDNCGAICDEYAEKDSRIIVIHQKNQGVSAARNAGLDIARGTYLGFVDSDDWIEPEMYETMIATAKEKQVDVVVCGIQYWADNGELIRKDLIADRSYTNEEMLKCLYGKPNPTGGAVWNKIFLRSSVSAIRFQRNISMAEDWIYLFECYEKCRSTYHIPSIYNNVVERRSSATRKNEIDALYRIVFGGKSVLLLLARAHSFELECLATDKYIDDCLRYSNLMREIGKTTGASYRWKFFRTRLQAAKLLPRAALRKLLPGSKLRGYLYSLIKT